MVSPEPGVRSIDALDVQARRRVVAIAVLVAVVWISGLLLVYFVAPWSGGGTVDVSVRVGVSLAILVLLTALAVPYVVRAPYPVLRAIQALSLVVALAVVSFASSYAAMSAADASAFSEPLSRIDALYFSVTTATTVGFGDISAASEAARVVVMLQMITNVVVIGVAVRVLPAAARRQRSDR